MIPEPIVMCGVCHAEEVNDPWRDQCQVCGRKLCLLCIEDDGDRRFCPDCLNAGRVEPEPADPGA